jgi:hypothetical protein
MRIAGASGRRGTQGVSQGKQKVILHNLNVKFQVLDALSSCTKTRSGDPAFDVISRTSLVRDTAPILSLHKIFRSSESAIGGGCLHTVADLSP